jgi:poly-gamma-glutamate capsule biosynthesis protein CapA/YwtB (metallophosphatase superfamily)
MIRGYQRGLSCILVVCIILLSSCISDSLPRQNAKQPGQSRRPEVTPESTPAPMPAGRGITKMKVRAVGDIMAHMPVINSGLQADGTYNLKHLFEDIRSYLEGADIVTANLETTISNPEKGYGGFPRLRTPEALLHALRYAGFNLLTTANNHTFDGKEFGVHYTLNKLDEYGFLHTGSARSQEERDRVLIVDSNDIKAGILAYTYGTNGMEAFISNDNLSFMVNYIERNRMRQDISRAREAGAEVLIVSIHWGDEYVRMPNGFQKETADFLASMGVDIILGSHPHVIQPMERRNVTLEDGTEKEVFIIYSMGNFISNQQERYRDSGVIIDVEIIKDYDRETIELGEISYTPTWVYRFKEKGGFNYRILPVGQFLNGENDLSDSARERMREVLSETTEHLGKEGFQD